MYRTYILIALFISQCCTMSAQEIRINEVVASNSIIHDEDGDKSDWIEIYNYGGTSISLSDWTITDDPSHSSKWTFPDISLSPDQYLLLWASGKDRAAYSFVNNITSEGDQVKYIIPDENTSDNWRDITFNDSAWLGGITGIGYGDNDDNTEVPNGTRSIFLRKDFTITDKSEVSSLILDMDYDDAFVAYINGTEIARSDNILPLLPSHSTLASAHHEAEIYRGRKPSRFVLENNLQDLLEDGANVLAIQVHDVSGTSNDLTAIPFLSIYNSKQSTLSPPALLELHDINAHTNFKISAEMETIYLYNNTAILVDSIQIKQVPTDVSVGINSAGNLGYFDIPTPGTANGSAAQGIANSPILFSQKGGIVNPMNLSLSCDDPLSTIRFTLDATEPTSLSPIYNAPISINQNQVVRAKLFRDNYIAGSIHTETYIINQEHDLPVVTLVAEPDDLFDPDTGMYVLGPTFSPDFPHFGANFWEDWERPMHMDMYDTDGNEVLSINLGAKIFGGWSRANQQRSFSLFARKQFGAGKIDYPLFPSLPYQEFESIILRNAGNDWLRSNMRDIFMTSLMEGSHLDFQAHRTVAAYLNGSYWGLYNLREKISIHFLASKHNLDPDEIDLLEFGGNAIDGSSQEYNQLLTFISTNNTALEANYNYIKTQIDLDNYIQYQAAQIYFDNRDWPGNNIKYWKHKDGKWRWILYDTDFGYAPWNENDVYYNTLSFALATQGPSWPNPPWSTQLFRHLMKNEIFEHRFINQLADELNSRFESNRVIAHLNQLEQKLEEEMPKHFNRWGGNIANWSIHKAVMRTFANNRPGALRNHVKNYFGLPNHHAITLTNQTPQQGFVQINSLQIQQSSWSGRYFEEVPITLHAVAEPGYAFSHWEGDINGTSPNQKINMKSAMNCTAVFVLSAESPKVVINEIMYKAHSDFDTGDWIELHNPSAHNLDISGWELKDSDDSFTIPDNQLLLSNDFVIICRNKTAFESFFPKTKNVIGNFSFGLSSEGESLSLYSASGDLIDSLFYQIENPWPEDALGLGPSIELIDPELDNALGENWNVLHAFGSPGWDNRNLSGADYIAHHSFLSIFPNPTYDYLHVSTSDDLKTDLMQLRIFDLQGQLVIKETAFLDMNAQPFKIPVHHLEAGVYIIHWTSNGSRGSTRFIKI